MAWQRRSCDRWKLLRTAALTKQAKTRKGVGRVRPSDAESQIGQDVIDRIVRAVSGLRYGSVQIIVQDSKVVQIDKTEKLRFSDKPDPKS